MQRHLVSKGRKEGILRGAGGSHELGMALQYYCKGIWSPREGSKEGILRGAGRSHQVKQHAVAKDLRSPIKGRKEGGHIKAFGLQGKEGR